MLQCAAPGTAWTIATHELFEGLVTGCGLEFRPLPGSQRMLNDSRWLEGKAGSASPVRMIRLLAEHIRTLHGGILAVARQDAPDVLALTGITALGGYHVAEGLGLHGALGLAGSARLIRRELGLPPRSAREAVLGQPDPRRWPVFHGFSPAIVPRPADWPDGYQVTGYWWPARPAGWNPPPDLERFLDSGPSPVFLGFGSLTPEDTGELIELAASASGRAGVRLVMQAGQAGPPSAGRSPGDSIVVGDVPHVGDQPFWAARLAALGAGPPPIPRSQLSVPVLAAAIRDAVARPSYRTQAEAMSRRLATEDGAAPVISMLARLGNS